MIRENTVKKTYFKYLRASFGSAIISSIYSMVDMAMVGNYQGPSGTAALAVVMPVWNIIYSLGLLMGIGGSVLYSKNKGDRYNQDNPNEWYTAAGIGLAVIACITWIGLILFDARLLTAFGATKELLPLCRAYVKPIKFILPVFMINQFLSAFLRNDNDPSLAMKGVMAGGIFNVFGDYLCVFILNWGMFGAGFATAVGSVITMLVMCMHFKGTNNSLHFVHADHLFSRLKNIIITGFSTFFIDVAMGIITVLFNRQILAYLGSDALSVYGVICSVSSLVQCSAYSIGQAGQPIISVSYGSKNYQRIKVVLKYCLIMVAAFAMFWTILSEAVPDIYIHLFMTPTDAILAIGPKIIRTYSLSYLLLPLNIFSTYYFQALLKPKASFIVSVSRGVIISGILISLLPLIRADSIWLAMPVTEAITGIYAIYNIRKYTNELDHS